MLRDLFHHFYSIINGMRKNRFYLNRIDCLLTNLKATFFIC